MERETAPILDELVSGEDEFEVDLMACMCRLVAVPAPSGPSVIAQYLAEMPGFSDPDALRRLIVELVEQHSVTDKEFFRAVDNVGRSEAAS